MQPRQDALQPRVSARCTALRFKHGGRAAGPGPELQVGLGTPNGPSPELHPNTPGEAADSLCLCTTPLLRVQRFRNQKQGFR